MFNISNRRYNHIIAAVNDRIPKEQAGLLTPEEETAFDNLIAEAEKHMQKWGSYPTFELCEIDFDDPALDIYNSPVNRAK